jgi:hypothetical protein
MWFGMTGLAVALAACVAPNATPYPAPPSSESRLIPPRLAGPADPHMARIYFYRRIDHQGTPEWTSVSLNGAKVGDSGPGTYFYRDVRPGTYTVTLRSERTYPDQFQTINVVPGGTRYIEIFTPDLWALSFMGPIFPNSAFGQSVNIPATFADAVPPPYAARAAIATLHYRE